MITGRIKATADVIKDFNIDGSEGSYTSTCYAKCYNIIRRANDILLNVPEMEISESTKNRVLGGEAYFMRAFSYFWVAHTYGDDVNGGVPIITVDNMFNDGGTYSRPASVVENYKQIEEDLKKLQTYCHYLQSIAEQIMVVLIKMQH